MSSDHSDVRPVDGDWRQALVTGGVLLVVSLVYFLLVIGYYIAAEFYLGATPGKKAMGLKVVSDSGPLTIGAVILRNVLRIVDGLPIFYLVGFICAAVRPDSKRIGDIVAKTSVVAA